MNPNFKDPGIRSLGLLTQVTPSGEVRMIQTPGYVVAPLANSRFVPGVGLERPLTTVGIPPSSRFVTPEIRQGYRNAQQKHSAYSASEHQLDDRPSGNRLSGMEFDYQKQYEKLLVKYRKKEQKNKRHQKDLTNQIIVKDSIINNFEQEIASYRAPDSERLQQELDQTRRRCDEQEREMSSLKMQLQVADQDKRQRESEQFHQPTVTETEFLRLNSKLLELDGKLQQAMATSDKASKDRDYFVSRVADAQKQLKVKDEIVQELENTLNHTTQQLQSTRRDLELRDARFVDKANELSSNNQRIMALKDNKIRDFQQEAGRRLSQLADLQRQVESIQQEVGSRMEEQRQQFEKKLQGKDLKLFETDSERLKLSRQVSDLTKQLQASQQQHQLKLQLQQKLVQSQNEKLEQLGMDVTALNKQIYELKGRSKLELANAQKENQAKITQLEQERNKLNHANSELRKQLENNSRQSKLTEEHLKQTAERNGQVLQLKQEALERELEARNKQLAELKAHSDNVLLQQLSRADEVKQDLLQQLQSKREALHEAERQLEEAKNNAAQSSAQLGYRLQEQKKLLKAKESRLQQVESDLSAISTTLVTQRDEHRTQLQTHQARQEQLRQDNLRNKKLISELEGKLGRVNELQVAIDTLVQNHTAKLEETNKSHRLHIEMKEKRITELQQKQLELVEELGQAKLAQQQQAAKLADAQLSLGQLKKDLDSRKQQVEGLSNKILSDQSNRDALFSQKEATIRELQQELHTLNPELARAHQQLSRVKQESDIVKKLLREKDAQISGQVSRAMEATQQSKEKSQQISLLTADIEALSAELNKAKGKLSSDKQESDSRVNSLASQILRLQNEVQSLGYQHSEKTSTLEGQLNARKNECSQLESELAHAKLTESGLRKVIEAKEQELSRQGTLIQQLRQEQVNRQQLTERKNSEQLMYVQQDREKLQAELVMMRLTVQDGLHAQSEKERDLATSQARVAYLTNENDLFRKEIIALNNRMSEIAKGNESQVSEAQQDRSAALEKLRSLQQTHHDFEAKILLKDRQAKMFASSVSSLQQQIKNLTESNSLMRQDVVILRDSLDQATNQLALRTQELTVTQTSLNQKEQERLLLSEALFRQRKETEQLLNSNQSAITGQESVIAQLQECKKNLSDQFETIAKLKADLDESRNQTGSLEAQLEQAKSELLSKSDMLQDQKAQIAAMEMIMEKLRKVQDGESEKQSEWEKTAATLSEKANALERRNRELEQSVSQLNEQLAQGKALNESLQKDKSEADQETAEAVRNIQAQMQQLQQVSQKVLEKQEADRQEYSQRLQEKQLYIGELVETIQRLHHGQSRSQQTSPSKQQRLDDGEFVRLQDFELAVKEKQKEIDKLRRVLDLQRRAEEGSAAMTPRKNSEVESRRGDTPRAADEVAPPAQPVLNYELKYKTLLISLELAEDECDETICSKVQSLLATNSRYEKSVQDLMQKINWMEENLNLLNQENNDFHLELESKDNAAAQLSKTIAQRDKTIVELRNYESHLAKKMAKTEELLEVGNRAIINLELRLLSDRHEFKELEEVLLLERQSLQDRVRMLRSTVKSEDEPTEEPELRRHNSDEQSVLQSGSFRRMNDSELLANISFLSGLIRLRDNSYVERLYGSEQFADVREEFLKLAREELRQAEEVSLDT